MMDAGVPIREAVAGIAIVITSYSIHYTKLYDTDLTIDTTCEFEG